MRPRCFKAVSTNSVPTLPEAVLCSSESKCILNYSDSSLLAGEDRTELYSLKKLSSAFH